VIDPRLVSQEAVFRALPIEARANPACKMLGEQALSTGRELGSGPEQLIVRALRRAHGRTGKLAGIPTPVTGRQTETLAAAIGKPIETPISATMWILTSMVAGVAGAVISTIRLLQESRLAQSQD